MAEKRKQLLDEFSIEQQKISTDHKEQIENLEMSYKEAAKNNEDEYKVQSLSLILPFIQGLVMLQLRFSLRWKFEVWVAEI